MSMNGAQMDRMVERIRGAHPDLEPEVQEGGWIQVKPPRERLYEVAEYLRDAEGLKFHYLANLTSVDWMEEGRFELVTHLLNLETHAKLVLKADIPREEPTVASLTPLWPTAAWQEREVWDMMGIRFEGHPDHRRILMKEGWPGHPLRKDYEDWRPVRERKSKESYDPSVREGELPTAENGA